MTRLLSWQPHNLVICLYLRAQMYFVTRNMLIDGPVYKDVHWLLKENLHLGEGDTDGFYPDGMVRGESTQLTMILFRITLWE